MNAAGPSRDVKRGDARRVRLFGPSVPVQAGMEPRTSAPPGGSAAHEKTSAGALS